MSIQKIIPIFLIIVLFSCASNPTSTDKFTTAPLNGKIFDYENLACSGVIVNVDNHINVKSDINGRFTIASLDKGEHTFKLTKDGFEELEFTFDFINKNQVLWLKMISLEQMIKLIEKNIDENESYEAEKLIIRAQKIDPDNPIVCYLAGVLYIQNKWYDKALEMLTKIIESGNEEPIVYLTLADLYDEYLDNPAKALEYLEKYTSVVYDEDANARIEDLRNMITPQD